MGMVQRSTITLSAAIMAASVLVTACSASVNDPDPAATAHQSAQRYRGMVGKVGVVLEDMNLRPDQRATVDNLLSEVDTKAEPVRAARVSLTQVLVEGIVAGKIDEARAEAKIADLKNAVETLRPAVETSMNKLHATLGASQREELVDAMRERGIAGRESKRGRMKQLMEELKLTGDQKERIIAAVKAELGGDREQMREKFKQAKHRAGEFADAFVGEPFDVF